MTALLMANPPAARERWEWTQMTKTLLTVENISKLLGAVVATLLFAWQVTGSISARIEESEKRLSAQISTVTVQQAVSEAEARELRRRVEALERRMEK